MNAHKQIISGLFEQKGFPDDAFYLDKVLQGRKIIVYGAGESFHYFKEIVMRQYGYMPGLVLDRKFSQGDVYAGIPASSPLEYKPTLEEKQNAIVVVCLGRRTSLDEVVLTLRKMGFHHIIPLMDIYEIHNPFSNPEELRIKGFDFYQEQQANILSCLELFTDEESCEIYTQSLQTHMHRKPVAIPMRDRNEQYYPKDIRLARGYSRFIYCGVSVGEMARLLHDVGKVDDLVCFEPDPNQFRLATEYLALHRNEIAEHAMIMPCAAYSHTAIEPFTYSETSFGSRIVSSGKSQIQAVSIDQVLPGFHPTFMNMDIEGAELEALNGAEKTIQECRPDLAICVYHSPHHLWEIPLFLHGLQLGYRFFLRNYTTFTSETVLYATI